MSVRNRLGGAWRKLMVKSAGWAMTLGGIELLRDAFVRPSKAGKVVNEETMFYTTTVLAVWMRIAFGVAQVPWKLFESRKSGKGKDEARDHSLWKVLHRKPNEFQTSFAFRVTMMLHLLARSRFIGFVNRVGGEIVEILPLEPKRVQVERVRGSWERRYYFTGDDGQRREIPAADIWHVPGPSWDGWDGLDFVKLARETIGLAIASEENQIDQQKRGGRIPGVLALEGNVAKENYGDLSQWIRDQVQKDIAETGVMMVDKAAKFYPTSMTGLDAETLATRKYQAEEICRHWGLLPEMIGLGSGVGITGVEQKGIWHVTHTLDPWMVCIEQSAENSLLTEEEQKTYSISFIRAGLMRGALKESFDAFAVALGRGATGPGQQFMVANEVRDLLDMNPIDGWDKPAEFAPPTPTKPPTNKPAE